MAMLQGRNSTRAVKEVPRLNPGGAIIPLFQRYEVAHRVRYEFSAEYLSTGRIVDFGCGYGFGTDLVASRTKNRVLGLDVDPRCIAYANTHYGRPNLEFSLLERVAIPVEDRSVALLILFEVLEHLYDVQVDELLREAKRVLGPEGLIIGSTPNANLRRVEDSYHIREFTLEDLSATARSSGFKLRAMGQGGPLVGPKRFIEHALRFVPSRLKRISLMGVLKSLFFSMKTQKLEEGDPWRTIAQFEPTRSAHIVFLMRRIDTSHGLHEEKEGS